MKKGILTLLFVGLLLAGCSTQQALKNDVFPDGIPKKAEIKTLEEREAGRELKAAEIRKLVESFMNWKPEDHAVSAEDITDSAEEFAVIFDEKLRVAGLLPSEHGTDSLVLREQNGEKFLYGWIDGKAYWLPEKFVNEAEKLLLPAK